MRISDWSSDVCSSDLSERAIEAANGPAPAMASADYFPSRPKPTPSRRARRGPRGWALYIAKQNSRLPPSSAVLRPLSLRSAVQVRSARRFRSEEHTSELQSIMRISYAVLCLQKKTYNH